ncbi:MAG: Gfo/Idh/MocA family oxidoreductase [Balneolaceae bacterium]
MAKGNSRKDFLKTAGLGMAGLTMAGASQSGGRDPFGVEREQIFNMHTYAAPPMEHIRVGLIGIGARGSGTTRRLAGIEGVEIVALCDIVPERVEETIESISMYPQHSPESYTDGPEAWKELVDRDDIDLIYTATPWSMHYEICKRSMESEKHVYVEIPAATTVEECMDLVETSERTRKHCVLMSATAHSGINAVTLNMCRQGFFGDLIHGEGNYIHDRISDIDSRWVRDEHGWFGYRPWRLDENAGRNGNLYPQHGLAPLAQMMDINYGDQMDYMVSMSSDDFSMGPLMEQLAEEDDYFEPYVGQPFRGNMNTTIIRTKRGRTMMLQHDISSPRPGSRFQLVSGTGGIYRHYPTPARIATSHDGWLPDEEYEALVDEYTPPITHRFRELQEEARDNSDLRSYARVTETDWRLIDCLRNGLPLDQNVYDAALYSCITPLTEWSVANGSRSVSIPDFTGGSWQENPRGMDIALERGNGSTRLL